MAIKITGLYLYPIKGCSGCKVTHLTLMECGALHDREYLLVDKDGTFISQRTHPKLAQVKTLVGHDQVVAWVGSLPNDPYIILELGEKADLVEDDIGRHYVPIEVEIRNHAFEAVVVQNEEAQHFFRNFLEEVCTLVRFLPSRGRTRHSASPNREFTLLGQDGYHLLVTSEESLIGLNRLMILNRAEPVPMSRFRPNIVLSGGEMYEEDLFSSIATDNIEITFDKLAMVFGQMNEVPEIKKVFFGSHYSVAKEGRLEYGGATAERFIPFDPIPA